MLIFHVFGAMAELQRSLIRERTKAGLQATRASDRLGGRLKAMDVKTAKMVLTLHADGKTPISEICRKFKVSSATCYRNLKLAA